MLSALVELCYIKYGYSEHKTMQNGFSIFWCMKYRYVEYATIAVPNSHNSRNLKFNNFRDIPFLRYTNSKKTFFLS